MNKRLRVILVMPVIVLTAGTAGFMITEKLSFINALYFTIVTVSTVGYGDIHPMTTAGKIFGIIIITTGIGTFLTIVTSLTQLLVARGQENLRRQRLDMLVGLFFTEVGNQLLRTMVSYDPNASKARQEFIVGDHWTASDFNRMKQKVRQHEFAIDHTMVEFDALRDYLKDKGDLFVRHIENSDLHENEAFAELLWAAVHLREELMARPDFVSLPESDLKHLANDAKRTYNLLVGQWLYYLQHLKARYPYLYSFALRTNPFGEKPSPIIK